MTEPQDAPGTPDSKHAASNCAECGTACEWNPTGFCSWDCFDMAPRDGAPEAFAYFMGLGPGKRVDEAQETAAHEGPAGCGQVWELPLWPLWSPFRSPIPTTTPSAPVTPGACYDASFGRVHVKPDCRCPR